jgi:FixJ family two-component response regulator
MPALLTLPVAHATRSSSARTSDLRVVNSVCVGSPRTSAVPTVLTSTVLIVTDDVSVRDSLNVLSGASGWTTEMFGSASEFFAQPTQSVPSCLVLDMELPDADGLEIQRLLADRPELPIVFVSSREDVRKAVRAIQQGAVEFLLKPPKADLLYSAIELAFDRSRAALARRMKTESLRTCYESLTKREREVMALVVCGLLNKQSAAELGVSEITVKAHRGQMMRKMGARSLPNLVNMAAELGLPLHTSKTFGLCERPADASSASIRWRT